MVLLMIGYFGFMLFVPIFIVIMEQWGFHQSEKRYKEYEELFDGIYTPEEVRKRWIL